MKSTAGSIQYDGKEISKVPAHKIVGRGLCHVPEGRMIFANLTVHENLKMGAYLQHDRKWIAEQTEYVFGLFPGSRNVKTSPPERFPAASSRCWPSVARCSASRSS